jgi:hypothetical protein
MGWKIYQLVGFLLTLTLTAVSGNVIIQHVWLVSKNYAAFELKGDPPPPTPIGVGGGKLWASLPNTVCLPKDDNKYSSGSAALWTIGLNAPVQQVL